MLTALHWLLDVARGMRYLHSANTGCIAHRDLKPENVLLSEAYDGRMEAKVADFGLFRVLDPAATPSPSAPTCRDSQSSAHGSVRGSARNARSSVDGAEQRRHGRAPRSAPSAL